MVRGRRVSSLGICVWAERLLREGLQGVEAQEVQERRVGDGTGGAGEACRRQRRRCRRACRRRGAGGHVKPRWRGAGGHVKPRWRAQEGM